MEVCLKSDREFDEVGRVVRHITFSNPEYLWGEGSGFFISYNGSVYFVTAKHNIFKRGKIYASELMVADHATRLLVPFDMMLFGNKNETDVDLEDFAVFHVDQRKAFEAGIHELHSIKTGDESMLGSKVPDGTIMRCAGYPTTDDPYDWDKKTKSVHLLIKEGVKVPSSLGEGFGALKGEVSTLNFSGLSGAPVLAYIDDKWLWVGVVVRASSGGVINYINTDLIFDVLKSSALVGSLYDCFKNISDANI
ncbi:hypothetical protein ALO42_200024 [Pseudomonas syringae pv. atrofaciens]|nr:hypothetical protein ALO42_200024 [Pseudomonas syringae pv. atrofaciens]